MAVKDGVLAAFCKVFQSSQAPKPHSYTDTMLSPCCVHALVNCSYCARERIMLCVCLCGV